MSALGALVDATLADPLAAARSHAAAGGRVIAHYGCNVPVELMLAAGAFPLQLPHRTDGTTPRADLYMETLFDRALRSVFDRWLAGDFDFIDTVVLPRAQDSAQRCYYYVMELIRTGHLAGPAPQLFDLLKVPRASSEAYTIEATRRLAAALQAPPARLPDAIARLNGRRRLFERLRRRMAEGRLPDAVFAARVGTAALHAEPAAFDGALGAWLDAPACEVRDGPRIALLGSPPPDERLHHAIDRAGGVLVAEHHLFDLARHGPPIDVGDDAAYALGCSYHARVASVRDFGAPLEAALARSPNLQGAVLWLTDEEDALAWQVPGLERAARAAGVPLLSLSCQDWLAGDETLDAVESFVAKLLPR